jgi:hypothetical protein
MGHRFVSIPKSSEKPRFYPAQEDDVGEWVGVTGIKDVDYRDNVKAARAAAAGLSDAGARIDAIIMVDRTGSAALKVEVDSVETHKTFLIPDKIFENEARFYIAAPNDNFDSAWTGVGKAEGYWRSLMEARSQAERFIREGVNASRVIKVTKSGREYFNVTETSIKNTHPDFGSW